MTDENEHSALRPCAGCRRTQHVDERALRWEQEGAFVEGHLPGGQDEGGTPALPASTSYAVHERGVARDGPPLGSLGLVGGRARRQQEVQVATDAFQDVRMHHAVMQATQERVCCRPRPPGRVPPSARRLTLGRARLRRLQAGPQIYEFVSKAAADDGPLRFASPSAELTDPRISCAYSRQKSSPLSLLRHVENPVFASAVYTQPTLLDPRDVGVQKAENRPYCHFHGLTRCAIRLCLQTSSSDTPTAATFAVSHPVAGLGPTDTLWHRRSVAQSAIDPQPLDVRPAPSDAGRKVE
ncbi:hypothetical protein L1887_50572 [Cichorium endivia]|nr:hypothetical protein L1887_50572 [Cichorium endivia]